MRVLLPTVNQPDRPASFSFSSKFPNLTYAKGLLQHVQFGNPVAAPLQTSRRSLLSCKTTSFARLDLGLVAWH